MRDGNKFGAQFRQMRSKAGDELHGRLNHRLLIAFAVPCKPFAIVVPLQIREECKQILAEIDTSARRCHASILADGVEGPFSSSQPELADAAGTQAPGNSMFGEDEIESSGFYAQP